MNIEIITEKFIKEKPHIYQKMSESTHSFSESSLNPYHIEDNIWTHTMMVTNYAKQTKQLLEIQIASLLHDIGKPYVWEATPKGSKSFHGHEGFGAFLAIDFLKSLKVEIPNLNIVQICNLIADHSVFYKPIYNGEVSKKSKDKLVKRFTRNLNHLKQLKALNVCDMNGSLSLTNQSNEIENLIEYVLYELEPSLERHRDDFENEIVMMIGPPGAGKTTYIKQIYKDTNYFIMSRDDIVMEIGEGENYNEKWKTADQKLVSKIFNDRLIDLKKRKKDIIIDMTMMGRKTRRKILSQFNNYYKFATCFYTDVKELFKRNENRDEKYIPNAVLKNMIKTFEPPMYDEFDEIKNII